MDHDVKSYLLLDSNWCLSVAVWDELLYLFGILKLHWTLQLDQFQLKIAESLGKENENVFSRVSLFIVQVLLALPATSRRFPRPFIHNIVEPLSTRYEKVDCDDNGISDDEKSTHEKYTLYINHLLEPVLSIGVNSENVYLEKISASDWTKVFSKWHFQSLTLKVISCWKKFKWRSRYAFRERKSE